MYYSKVCLRKQSGLVCRPLLLGRSWPWRSRCVRRIFSRLAWFRMTKWCILNNKFQKSREYEQAASSANNFCSSSSEHFWSSRRRGSHRHTEARIKGDKPTLTRKLYCSYFKIITSTTTTTMKLFLVLTFAVAAFAGKWCCFYTTG